MHTEKGRSTPSTSKSVYPQKLHGSWEQGQEPEQQALALNLSVQVRRVQEW